MCWLFRGKSVSWSFGCVGYSGGNLSAGPLDVLVVQGKICQLVLWICWIFRGNSICQLLLWMCWMFSGKCVSCSFGCVGCSGGICQQFFSMISVGCWREALALLLKGRMELVFTPQSSMTAMSGESTFGVCL